VIGGLLVKSLAFMIYFCMPYNKQLNNGKISYTYNTILALLKKYRKKNLHTTAYQYCPIKFVSLQFSGKRPASKSPNAVPAKKAKDKDSEAGSSMSASDQSTECEILYDSVLNSKNDESEENTTRSGDEDDFLSELVKEYEYDDTVGESLENEKLAKLVDRMFRCKLSEKNLKDRLER